MNCVECGSWVHKEEYNANGGLCWACKREREPTDHPNKFTVKSQQLRTEKQ